MNQNLQYSPCAIKSKGSFVGVGFIPARKGLNVEKIAKFRFIISNINNASEQLQKPRHHTVDNILKTQYFPDQKEYREKKRERQAPMSGKII
jgi:hypothetical protein